MEPPFPPVTKNCHQKIEQQNPLETAYQRNIDDLIKYNKLLAEHIELQKKFIITLNSNTNLIEGLCDYIEELDEKRKWWWFSLNLKISQKLLEILATRKSE